MWPPCPGSDCLSAPYIASMRRWHCLTFLACALALQSLLLANPGYFSHDELQWGARAAIALDRLDFVSFTDWDQFQFRPLTFNLWMLLSHALFDTPHLFHAAFVLAGSLLGLLLARVLVGAGCRAGVAFGAGLAFVCSPYAVWVHGWVGCLGDLLWVGCGLAIVVALQRLGTNHRALALAALVAAGATALGLYSKEAALSIPALLGLATLLLRFPRTWLVATISSGAVAVAYLVLRLDVLMNPGEASSYAMQPSLLPRRWFEYLVFPWALGVREIHTLMLVSWQRMLLMAVMAVLLPMALWRVSGRLLLAWVLGGLLVLAPVLVLPTSFAQYGYGYAALTCGIAAMAWMRLSRNWHGVLALLALASSVHGVQVQRHMLKVGTLQSVFSPSLAQAAQAQPQGDIRVWAEETGQSDIYTRLSSGIPSYGGVILEPRVRMATSREAATHLVEPDGTVRTVDEGKPEA